MPHSFLLLRVSKNRVDISQKRETLRLSNDYVSPCLRTIFIKSKEDPSSFLDSCYIDESGISCTEDQLLDLFTFLDDKKYTIDE